MARSLFLLFGFLVVAAVFCVDASSTWAREASFLKPNTGAGSSDSAVIVEPKADIEVGETTVDVSKRVTIFFANQTSTPVTIESIALTSDTFVEAEKVASDCEKQGQILPLSRCSVEISVTPSGEGAWSVDVLMTHNGAGRIARARLSGRTPGFGEGKNMGLAVSSHEVKPIDFGSVDADGGKIVRSSLMVNDSPDVITIQSIDVIEASNGLERLDQGCKEGMVLAPGAACPVTLLWIPENDEPVSTDLIIRHSGKLGFAVIPVRGAVKNVVASSGKEKTKTSRESSKNRVPLPLSAKDLENEIKGKIPQISVTSSSNGEVREIWGTTGSSSRSGGEDSSDQSKGKLSLIGTVGARGLFLLPSGEMRVASVGEELDTGLGFGRLVAVRAQEADLMVNDKLLTVPLQASDSLISFALEQNNRRGDTKGEKPGGNIGVSVR